jgi:hypothetical protein
MHMAPRAAAWVAWAVWTCNTPQQGIWSKESGLRSALFLGGYMKDVAAGKANIGYTLSLNSEGTQPSRKMKNEFSALERGFKMFE